MKKLLIAYALSLTSGFTSSSFLKERIKMLYKKPSAKLALAKFAFVFPLLGVCLLITSFTQRERLLQATETTWKNLVQEVKKVYQQASSPAQVASEKEEVKDILSIEPLKRVGIATTASMTGISQKEITPIPVGVYHIEEQATEARYDSMSLKTYHLDTKKGRVKYSYIFTKGNQYFFGFGNCCTKTPIYEGVTVKIYKENEEEPLVILKSGNTFTAMATGMYKIAFDYDIQVDCCIYADLFYTRNGRKNVKISSQYNKKDNDAIPYLATLKGKEINLSKKVFMKKNTQILFKPTIDKSTFQVGEMHIVAFRGGKAIGHKRVYNGIVDIKDMNLQKEDAIQISLDKVTKKDTEGKTNAVEVRLKYMAFFVK